jgi:phage-related protein
MGTVSVGSLSRNEDRCLLPAQILLTALSILRTYKTMPATKVVIYQEENGTVPLLAWLDDLPAKVQLKCLARIERLRQEGHALRRPEADLLRDKIYELRVGFNGIHYRMLYFFHGSIAAVLAHGLMKTDLVPPHEIDLAVARMRKFIHHPEAHTYKE